MGDDSKKAKLKRDEKCAEDRKKEYLKRGKRRTGNGKDAEEEMKTKTKGEKDKKKKKNHSD